MASQGAAAACAGRSAVTGTAECIRPGQLGQHLLPRPMAFSSMEERAAARTHLISWPMGFSSMSRGCSQVLGST